jgi:hypothetical protein
VVPSAGDNVTLPENTKVLITSCSLHTASPYGLIVIPASSALIFDDATIVLRTRGIIVNGRLSIGSETCRLFSTVRVVLYGTKSEVTAGAPQVSSQATKGIVALGFGVIDMHGMLFKLGPSHLRPSQLEPLRLEGDPLADARAGAPSAVLACSLLPQRRPDLSPGKSPPPYAP